MDSLKRFLLFMILLTILLKIYAVAEPAVDFRNKLTEMQGKVNNENYLNKISHNSKGSNLFLKPNNLGEKYNKTTALTEHSHSERINIPVRTTRPTGKEAKDRYIDNPVQPRAPADRYLSNFSNIASTTSGPNYWFRVHQIAPPSSTTESYEKWQASMRQRLSRSGIMSFIRRMMRMGNDDFLMTSL